MRTNVAFNLPPRQFVVLNATTKPAVLRYAGEERRVPPRDQFIPGSSAKDADGNPIPGTLVIADLYDGSNLKFTALDFLKHVFGITDGGECTTLLWAKGLAPLEINPKPEQVAEVRNAAMERWNRWEVREATQLVAAHDSRNEARQRVRLPALAPTPDYMKAQAVLEAANAELVARYKAEFQVPEYQEEEPRRKKSEEISDDELVEEISSNRKLMRMLRAKLKGKKSSKGKVLAKKDQPKPAEA